MRPKTPRFPHHSLFAAASPRITGVFARSARVTLAARLTGKTGAEIISAMLPVFGRIDLILRRSITFDNHTAFAQHRLLSTRRDMTTWFCDAYVIDSLCYIRQ